MRDFDLVEQKNTVCCKLKNGFCSEEREEEWGGARDDIKKYRCARGLRAWERENEHAGFRSEALFVVKETVSNG